MATKVTIKNIHGNYKPFSLFSFFDDGIRKRLPKRLAESFKQKIIENIDSNVYGFQLNQRWVDYKRSVGGDTRPFIMFGHYKNAITIVTEAGHLSVGFKKTQMHPRAGIPIAQLAVRLEYGDLARGIPARPLWRKTANDYFKRDKKAIMEQIKKSLEAKK